MHIRGSVYWKWADPEIHFRNKDERLSDGTFLSVQVRTSRTGETQLFLGVYGQHGAMLLEESFDSRPGETMTQAMTWGLARAKEFVAMTKSSAPISKPEQLPRKGSGRGI
ncbi:hypothetical protein [Pseudomonas jessenii]|uniref:Uncharacterized protein n=1 Tax=Pseudomonas jessenii TaxID=77298 RepID=A0A370S126_PSEJE|nr:hypothetical protein [Pseudomonas jessenii]RDL13469.1 hypothetical protein DEU51_12566 [Pseudomonas jessenii]